VLRRCLVHCRANHRRRWRNNCAHVSGFRLQERVNKYFWQGIYSRVI